MRHVQHIQTPQRTTPTHCKGKGIMNKTELVEAVTQTTELSKAAAGKAVDAIVDAIGKALKQGDSVVLTGFGTFSIRERPAR